MWQANRANKLPENLRIIMLSMWYGMQPANMSIEIEKVQTLTLSGSWSSWTHVTAARLPLYPLSSNEFFYRRVR